VRPPAQAQHRRHGRGRGDPLPGLTDRCRWPAGARGAALRAARRGRRRQQVGELSQRVGRLEAELEPARANGQAPTPTGAAAPWPERRRWWQRVVFG
jgi:hypothetical protein